MDIRSLFNLTVFGPANQDVAGLDITMHIANAMEVSHSFQLLEGKLFKS